MTYRLSSTTSSDNQFPSRKQEANSIRHYNLTIKRNWRRTRLRQSTSCHQKLKRISMISRRRVSLLAWRNLVGCCLEMRWELERPSRRLALHIYTDKIGQCLLWRQLLSSLHGETNYWSGCHHWDHRTYSFSRRDQRVWTRIAVSNCYWFFVV